MRLRPFIGNSCHVQKTKGRPLKRQKNRVWISHWQKNLAYFVSASFCITYNWMQYCVLVFAFLLHLKLLWLMTWYSLVGTGRVLVEAGMPTKFCLTPDKAGRFFYFHNQQINKTIQKPSPPHTCSYCPPGMVCYSMFVWRNHDNYAV